MRTGELYAGWGRMEGATIFKFYAMHLQRGLRDEGEDLFLEFEAKRVWVNLRSSSGTS